MRIEYRSCSNVGLMFSGRNHSVRNAMMGSTRAAPESTKRGGSPQKAAVRRRDKFSDRSLSLRKARFVMRAKAQRRRAGRWPTRSKADAFRAKERARESELAGRQERDEYRFRGRA